MKYTIKSVLLICLLSAFFVSCKKTPRFTIEGNINNAQGETLVLERRGFSDVTFIDSVKISGDGSFVIKGEAPEYPDLYILKLNGQKINITIDSIETIKVDVDKNAFSTGYTVSGSSGSERMKEVVLAKIELIKTTERLKAEYEKKGLSPDEYLSKLQEAVAVYKDVAKKVIITDLKSPAAYFTLFQKVGDNLIFDPYNKTDSRMYSALATTWDMLYKDSPRSQHLREFTLRSIKARRSAENQTSLVEYIEGANSNNFYNIELPDIKNNKRSLSSLKGKVVLLNFTVYQSEFSPIYNIAINKVYEKYKPKFEIYQISFDTDLHFWQNAASNLPWVCVRDESLLSSNLVMKFNLQQLPTSFILNADGEIVKRLTVADNPEEELKKLL